MVVHRRDRRGWHRGVECGRAGIDSIGSRRLRRRAPSRAGGALDTRHSPTVAGAFRSNGRRGAKASWARGMRTRFGGPFLPRHREPPVAPRLVPGDLGGPRPVRLQLGGIALAVAAAANYFAVTVRPFARLHPPPSASRRANSDSHFRPRCARGPGPPVVPNRLWTFASHGT